MDRLKNKIAVVSGAASGIGRGMCEVFAEEAAWVLVTDVNGPAAEEVAADIRGQGGQAESRRVDISDPKEIKRAVESVVDRFGRVDILCNNAAYIGTWHDVLEATEEEWDGCLNTTLRGTQNFTRAVLPSMMRQNRGSIIITSSIQGLVACPKSASYSTVKAGLIGFARSVACDYGRYNIRANVICPGPITVAYSPPPGHPMHDYQIKNTFLGRVGKPREIGQAALFFASDESSFVTGTTLAVDGGWTAM
jgi:NAD(P)-dependent dehydrogenase (short-subunit alcohol dehydrogenase family)